MAGRTLESNDARGVRLRIELSAPLPGPTRAALAEEVAVLAAHPIEGLVAPRAVDVEALAVVFELDPIHPGAVRLSDLLEGLRREPAARPLGDGLAAALTATAAQLAHKIHIAPGLRGSPRVHGACHPGALVLTPMGTVALLGTGLPTIDGLMMPQDPGREARHTAPERAADGPLDPRNDVFGLGVLYLTLLAGRTPWPDARPEDHLAALAAGRLENPGIAIPDPRPSLVELLRRAMAPSVGARYATALAFGQAISNELKASRRPRGDADALRALLEASVPASAPRGAHLLTGGAPPSRPVTVPKDTPTRPAPPSHDALVEASRAPGELGLGAWSHVLGEASETAPAEPSPPAAPAPAAAPTRGSGLPLPPAPGPSGSSGKSALPLPGAPEPGESGPTAPTLPAPPSPSLGGASAIEALYDDDVPSAEGKPSPKRAPRVSATSDEDQGSVKGTLVLGAVLLAGVGVIWGASKLGADDPEMPVAPDAALGVVAGPAAADAGAPPPAVPDAGHAHAARALDASAPKLKPLGFLTVFSTPTGATVQLDGGFVGSTPLVLKHDFDDSQVYELTVLHDGYKPWTKAVRPEPGKKSISVKAILEKR